jgi:nucleoside-diphosphate-sugar epimerase
MNFLVTGATGFAGSFVTDLLVSKGFQVRVLIRDEAKRTDFERRGIDVVIGELNDADAVARAVRGVEKVLHIAALFRQAGLPASEFDRVNVEGARNLLDRAIEAGVKRIVHCSTVGVHGHIESPPADESTPFNPGDPYQVSKAEGEKLFLEYVSSGRISGVVIRPAMIFGPGDTRTLKIFGPVARRRFFFVGKGNALVHFVDVRDLAEAFLLAAQREDLNASSYIIAGETSLPLRQLTDLVASLMGVPAPWFRLPVKPMQILGTMCETVCTPLKIQPPIFRRRVDFFTKDRAFDISKARRELGYAPSRSLVQELVEIIDSYVESGIIPRSLIQRPTVLLRTTEGRIQFWSDGDGHRYGWTRCQTIGENSHELFATQFPVALPEIEKELMSRGRWNGLLHHRDRSGREVQVRSSWTLLRCHRSDTVSVLELNHVLGSENKGRGTPLKFRDSVSAGGLTANLLLEISHALPLLRSVAA